jgi:hypothetical protein
MKSVLSIVLLASFLMVNLSQSFILMNYEINKKDLTEKYCINKDKPEMHCCAKCLLKRKLAEQDEQQKLPVFPDIKIDILLNNNEQGISYIAAQNSVLTPYYLPLSPQAEGLGVFHPPSC